MSGQKTQPMSRFGKLLVTFGVIVTLLGVCFGLSLLSQSYTDAVNQQMRRSNCLHSLAIATHDATDAAGVMPGPFLDGPLAENAVPENPTDRLSWRVSLLPYLENGPIYQQLNKSEPWDSPNNLPLIKAAYPRPTDPADGNTTHTPYRVFYDNGAVWDSDPKSRIPLDKIPDGASNTLLIVVSTEQVPWAQFNEHRYDPAGPLPPLGRANRDTFLAAMADGSVRTVKKSVSPDTLRAAITRAGNESLGPDFPK